MYNRSGSYHGKLLAPDGLPSNDVAIDNTDVFIVSYEDNVTADGINIGSAYYCKRFGNMWSVQSETTDVNGATNDYFGSSVALCDKLALIEAPGKDGISTDSGMR
jgi:hypothetical protein